MISTVSGIFVKIAFEDQVGKLLTRDSLERPAARFNRQGENALYLSANEASARVAMQKYVKASDRARVLIRYRVAPCRLLDLRCDAAVELREQSRQDWQSDFLAGQQPNSWLVADKLRAAGEVGLVDQSRKNPDMWHITLWRWNVESAPSVTLVESPVLIDI